MGENENTSSGATDTSSVTAISVKVVVDTTTAELKKQFEGIQKDIKDDPIGLTFGVDAKTSKDAIIKGLQAILGKDNNINIGASVDQNAGKKVQQGVQNAVNAGQQAANKNKVKVRVETDADAKGAKLDAFYRRVKEIGSLRATFQSKLSSGASSTELQGLYKQLKESKDEATELYKELQKVISVDDYSKLREIGRTQSRATDKANFSGAGNFEKELRTRAESRLASMKKQEQSAMVKSETADVKKAISAFDSELTKYKKLSVDQKNLQLKKSTHELPYVSSLIDSSKEKLRNLHKTLVDILPEDQLNEVLDRYAGFEEELQEKLRRAEEHYNDLNKALNDKKATAAEKEQAKQSTTLTDNLADAKSKYSTDKLSGAGDIQDALSKVQDKVDVLDALKVGTNDYAAALKEANDEWVNAKRLIDEFNTAQKNTENHVKNMTEQAAKWKESIKDSDTASQELRDSIDGIIDASKKLDSDHSSDAYKQGVKDLDDAFISAKASMSVYTDGYKNLESTAAKTLTEIRKKQLELQQAGNKSFDSILYGSGDGSADGSFESQFNYLKSLNSQSAEYKKVLEGIVEEWKKTKLQIEQALKSEEDLANEGKRQLKDVQDARGKLQSLRNEVNQKGQLHNTNLHNYVNGEDGNGGQFSEIENMINTTDASRGTAEFEANLEALKNKLKEVKQAIIEYKQEYQNSDAVLQEQNNLKELISQITAYKEKLVGLKPDSSIAQQFDEITEAAKQSQTSFKYSSKEIRSWFYNIQSDCRDAKLEVESLGQKLSRLFKEHFQTAIAMAGVAMVKQGLREVYNNVLDIDTAMTELKKVVDASDKAFDDFLSNAGDRARNVGASISDVINATADFARLGYSLDDATTISDAALVYKNVGDGISDINDASESLISTMQAFGVEAKDTMKIVDEFNAAGKLHCP